KTVAKRPTPKASTRTAKPAPRKAKAAAPKTKTPKPRALAVRSAPPRPAGSARRQKVADAKPASAVADQPQSRLLEDGPPTAESLRRLKQEISSQRGSTYFARMQYGRLVDSLLQERSAELVADVFDQLRGVAIASRTNKPIGDKMILNAAFLVAREREAEFDSRVKELGARHEHVNIRYTGPWPPYNFVNSRLKLERASE